MHRSFGAMRAVLAIALAMVGLVTSSSAQKKKAQAPVRAAASRDFPDTAALGALHYRYIGPEGNRTDAIAGVKGDPNVYYAGDVWGMFPFSAALTDAQMSGMWSGLSSATGIAV